MEVNELHVDWYKYYCYNPNQDQNRTCFTQVNTCVKVQKP
jgi:hypothetical protein